MEAWSSGAPPAPRRSYSGPPLVTTRPGFEHRTIVRLPATAGRPQVSTAPIDTGVLVETSPQDAMRFQPPPFSKTPGDTRLATRFRRTSHTRTLTAEPEAVAPPGGSLPTQSNTDPLPGELLPPGPAFRGEVQPLFDDLVQTDVVPLAQPAPRPSILQQWYQALRSSQQSGGIGRDRVMFAPLEIETTQPTNNLSLRFEPVYGLKYPDRLEYFWARTSAASGGKGPPLPEKSVDYQDLRFRFEAGSAAFSASTEVMLRSLDPVVNANTTGFGDMNIGTKLRLVDGESWQISQVLHTYILTGDVRKGLGVGHISLEPGLLFRYNRNELTYWHGEMKFWIPVGADPNQGGEVLKWGLGVSHILYDSDEFAVLPTLEMTSLMFLDGLRTGYPVPVNVPVDGEVAMNMFPGVRFVVDRGTLMEWGVGGGFTMGSSGWYNGLMRLDMRIGF